MLRSSPLGGRVRGHIEVKNATPVMGQYQRKQLAVDARRTPPGTAPALPAARPRCDLRPGLRRKPALNVVEWALVFMAQSRRVVTTTKRIPKYWLRQGARLAAILPAALKRRPERMNNYSVLTFERMRRVGW